MWVECIDYKNTVEVIVSYQTSPTYLDINTFTIQLWSMMDNWTWFKMF